MKIDTSTTAGKIAVMQAYEDGKEVQVRDASSCVVGWGKIFHNPPKWSWHDSDYRIKPQTVEEAAKAHVERWGIICADEKISLEKAAINDFKAGVKWRDENPKEDQ